MKFIERILRKQLKIMMFLTILQEENKLNNSIVISFIHLSEYYNRINDKKKSLLFANKGLYISKINIRCRSIYIIIDKINIYKLK
jgi:hypothetical protein